MFLDEPEAPAAAEPEEAAPEPKRDEVWQREKAGLEQYAKDREEARVKLADARQWPCYPLDWAGW